MFSDYILNGEGHGEVAGNLASCRFEPNLLRPWVDGKGRKCVAVQNGYDSNGEPKYKTEFVANLQNKGYTLPSFITNATSLRKDEWLMLDRQVIRAARQRLRAWSDLENANSFGGFNGMSKMILEHETMSDPGEAVVDMDGLTKARTDSPKYQLEGLPLPITHSDFWFSSRRLAVSRNTGTPLDSTMAEAAGRRVAETIEQTTIGNITGVTYGTAADYGRSPQVYGYTNFPARLTKTNMNAPTGSNGETVLLDFLTCIEQLRNNYYYGPYMVYTSTDWDRYLDDDYRSNDDRTLRQRLLQIEDIQDIRRLDYLTSTFTVLFVQMTSDVARAVNGMGLTTVQWETGGGMQINFKVMSIMVPQLRADFNSRTGILHATTA